MRMGIMSDTHFDRKNAMAHIMQEFRKRESEVVLHCGDIRKEHLSPELFLNFPVYCALNQEEAENPAFRVPPSNWRFTLPSNPTGDPANRILDINGTRVYLGHKRAFDYLFGSERKLFEVIEAARRTHDGLRWYFSGHTHHQIYMQGKLTNFVNPGAVEGALDGNYEFATIDTDTEEIVFSRILNTKPIIPDFSIGIVSDSLNISKMDPLFWGKLKNEFLRRGVGYVIHCGNIAKEDIGKEEMEPFTVFCNLRKDQEAPKYLPENWRVISKKNPVVEINGYRFYVQLDLGAKLLDLSEVDMGKLSARIRRTYPETTFALCGFTNNAFYEEGEEINIINPGDIRSDRNFCVLCLPRKEITFGHVPTEPLPAVAA